MAQEYYSFMMNRFFETLFIQLMANKYNTLSSPLVCICWLGMLQLVDYSALAAPNTHYTYLLTNGS